MRKLRASVLLRIVGALLLLVFLAGCKKKPPPAPPAPPPPPPAAAPTVQIQANPTTVERGQSTTLTWNSTNAVSVDLNGQKVDLNGTQQVSPTESTDYTATATNKDGKTATATAHVTVTEPPPPPPPPPPAPPAEDLAQSFNENIKDAFFDFDKSNIRGDAEQALTADATWLKAHPNVNVTIEGHCDERGSAEYNQGLGQHRADAAKDFLVQQGVDASHINTISYGKEKPFCTEHNENCWQQNRRAHLVMSQGATQ
jgi:peptidoglycan-associated lipoprotein